MKRFIAAGALGVLGLTLIPGSAGATPAPKVSVCHKTGSLTNPYVLITVSENAWLNAHSDHEGDVLATEVEVVVDIDRNGRDKTETLRFCPGPAPIPGPQGPAGPEGPQGPIGPPGQNGLDGFHGTDGLNGRDGKDGKDGADGLNAVQHKCVTIDGILYSSDQCRPLNIVGEAGPQGERGEIGPVGPQGPAGGTFTPASDPGAVADTTQVDGVEELAYTGNHAWWWLGAALILLGGIALVVRRVFR